MMRFIYILPLLVDAVQGSNEVQQYESMAGYEPQSLVTDVAALDQDQEAMENLLDKDNTPAFIEARKFYTEGANSLSVATLTLFAPLPSGLAQGTALGGQSEYGKEVDGQLYATAKAGDSQILFQYLSNTDSDQHLSCQVGALPVDEQVVTGCLMRKGAIMVNGSSTQVINYSYDPFVDNDNGRTLRTLSLDAKELMYECKNCPREEYMKFRTYYGKDDYADSLINAAFEGIPTTFDNGNINFARLSMEGRSAAIKMATKSMSVWMYVDGLMEASWDMCTPGCTDCNTKAAQLWDEAVALYTGSLQGTDGSGEGVFPYALSNTRCADFRTCGKKGDNYVGTSVANLEMFDLFEKGQSEVLSGNCNALHLHKNRILSLMRVPLVQSALKYAYLTERQEVGDEEVAFRAVSSASILPMIADCSPDDANLVWDSLTVGAVRSNFVLVKETLERNYKCLQITCEDIGGLFDGESRSYYTDADPCTRTGLDTGAIVGISFGSLFGLLAVLICTIGFVARFAHAKQKQTPDEDAETSSDSETKADAPKDEEKGDQVVVAVPVHNASVA